MPSIALLMYVPRSGSTFLSSVLDQYANFRVSIETDFLSCLSLIAESSFNDLHHTYDVFEKNSLSIGRIISRDDFINCLKGRIGLKRIDVALAVLHHHFGGESAEVYVVKSRGLPWNVNVIAEAIPELKFIHILRDGRAVLNSQYRAKRVYKKGYMASEPLTPAIIWRKWAATIDKAKRKYSRRLVEIQFEELLVKPDSIVEKLYGLFDERSGLEKRVVDSQNYRARIPTIELSLHENVGKGPQTSATDKWKKALSYGDIMAFEKVAGRTLEGKGYQLESHQHPQKFSNQFIAFSYYVSLAVRFFVRKIDGGRYRILKWLGLWTIDSKGLINK